MKYLFFLILVLLISLSCNNPAPSPEDALEKKDSLPAQSTHNSLQCFIGIDTTNIGQTVGCSYAAYKLLNKNYVIYIRPDFPIQYDSCYSITIDSTNGKNLTGLLVFDHKNANLNNLCTDLIVTDNPEPSRKLFAQSGSLILAFSNSKDSQGFPTNYVTVLIKKLVFIDFKTGKKIEIENELLWKVQDLGTPG